MCFLGVCLGHKGFFVYTRRFLGFFRTCWYRDTNRSLLFLTRHRQIASLFSLHKARMFVRMSITLSIIDCLYRIGIPFSICVRLVPSSLCLMSVILSAFKDDGCGCCVLCYCSPPRRCRCSVGHAVGLDSKGCGDTDIYSTASKRIAGYHEERQNSHGQFPQYRHC